MREWPRCERGPVKTYEVLENGSTPVEQIQPTGTGGFVIFGLW